MSAYTASQIETMARVFTTKQSEALSALEMPFETDGQIFEFMLDQLADNMKLSEAEWDLFASVARLQFFGSDAPAADRKRWYRLADQARDTIFDAAREDEAAQVIDYRRNAAREVVGV